MLTIVSAETSHHLNPFRPTEPIIMAPKLIVLNEVFNEFLFFPSVVSMVLYLEQDVNYLA